MAQHTTNYNLVKPTENEYYDVNVQNGNMDTIDTELKNIKDSLEGLSTEAKDTNFDNSENSMTSTNVQDAITENKKSIDALKVKDTSLEKLIQANKSNIDALKNEVGTNITLMQEDINTIRGVL